jgi:hypothetical protein
MPDPPNAGPPPATTPSANASILRHRAGVLRDLAITIERASAMSLDRDAGADTWLGVRPLLCHNVLLTNLMQVHGAVEDLRWNAWQLERRANEIDAAARLLQAATGGGW